MAALADLEKMLDEYLFKKAPALPENAKETLVKFAPYISILVMVIAIPGILAVIGLGTMLAPFGAFLGPAYALSYGIGHTVSMLVMAVTVIMEFMAIPGLFKRLRSAWNLMYWSTLISAVAGLVRGDILSSILSLLIGLYILFQVKSYYK